MRKLIPLDNIYGIYCDAWVLDDLGLLILCFTMGTGHRHSGAIGKTDLVVHHRRHKPAAAFKRHGTPHRESRPFGQAYGPDAKGQPVR